MSTPNTPEYKLGPYQRNEVNLLIEECQDDLELVLCRLVAQREQLREALTRISKATDAPEIDATGDWQRGLHCGVEDRDCRDRYEGADYGHAVGVEKGLEWARNEAQHALELMEKTT